MLLARLNGAAVVYEWDVAGNGSGKRGPLGAEITDHLQARWRQDG